MTTGGGAQLPESQRIISTTLESTAGQLGQLVVGGLIDVPRYDASSSTS